MLEPEPRDDAKMLRVAGMQYTVQPRGRSGDKTIDKPDPL
jgi:hypothetical protein